MKNLQGLRDCLVIQMLALFLCSIFCILNIVGYSEATFSQLMWSVISLISCLITAYLIYDVTFVKYRKHMIRKLFVKACEELDLDSRVAAMDFIILFNEVVNKYKIGTARTGICANLMDTIAEAETSSYVYSSQIRADQSSYFALCHKWFNVDTFGLPSHLRNKYWFDNDDDRITFIKKTITVLSEELEPSGE